MKARRIPNGEWVDVYYTGQKVISKNGIEKVYHEYGDKYEIDIYSSELRFEKE